MHSSSPSSSIHSVPLIAGDADEKSTASLSPTSTTMTSNSASSELDDNHHDNNPATISHGNDNNNSLDDIFGSSPVDSNNYSQGDEFLEHNRNEARDSRTAEPSDLPSLRRQHVTAGYRDGIAFSKSEHVQQGFDGGYPVGAQFGLRVGTILGILEGVVGGLESSSFGAGPVKKNKKLADDNAENSKEGEEARRRQQIDGLRELDKNALKELNIEALFGGLKDEEEGRDEGSGFTEESKPENRLRQKAESVVTRWEKLVDVTKWEEGMQAVEGMEDMNAEERKTG